MVKMRDITSEENEKTERRRLETELMKEYFIYEVDAIHSPSILIYKEGKIVASKTVGAKKMTIYDENFLSQAEKFAQKYERLFKIKDFIIETDYSKNK